MDFSLRQSIISPKTDVFADIYEQQCGDSFDEAELQELLHQIKYKVQSIFSASLKCLLQSQKFPPVKSLLTRYRMSG